VTPHIFEANISSGRLCKLLRKIHGEILNHGAIFMHMKDIQYLNLLISKDSYTFWKKPQTFNFGTGSIIDNFMI